MSGTNQGARWILCACLVLAATSCSRDRGPSSEAAQPAPDSAPQAKGALSESEAVAIATDAYIYGYSLITTEITRVHQSAEFASAASCQATYAADQIETPRLKEKKGAFRLPDGRRNNTAMPSTRLVTAFTNAVMMQ